MMRTLLLVAALLMVMPVTVVWGKEQVYYFHNDHLGTPQVMTDQAGRAVWKAVYEPFGEAIVDEDPDADGIPVECNLRFPGQYYDAETALHYNYHRTYDPKTGRYLEADPAGIRQGQNHLYVYAENNPISLQDPFGLHPGGSFDSVFAAAVNGASYAWQLSKAAGVEHGGWVMKSGNCFTYGTLYRGSRRELITEHDRFPDRPAGAANAWFHAHLPVTWADRYIARAIPEEFSPRDRAFSDKNQSAGYLNYMGVTSVYFPKGGTH